MTTKKISKRLMRWLLDAPVVGCDPQNPFKQGKKIGTLRDLQESKRHTAKYKQIQRIIDECNLRALDELRARKSARYPVLVRKLLRSYKTRTPEWLNQHKAAAARFEAARPKRKRKRRRKVIRIRL